MSDISNMAIKSVLESNCAFCKFISADDAGDNANHSKGIHISVKDAYSIFIIDKKGNSVYEKGTSAKFQNEYFVNMKAELKRDDSNKLFICVDFEKNNLILEPENIGDLFILTRSRNNEFNSYLLTTDDEFDDFLGTFGMGPTETNRIIKLCEKYV